MRQYKGMTSALLPQYQWFETFRLRFLETVYEQSEIKRSPNERGPKNIDQIEILEDALSYFSDQKRAMETEFHDALSEKMDREKVDWFCETIAGHWYDPGKRQSSPKVAQIKSSVREYLKTVGYDVTVANLASIPETLNASKSVLSVHDIAAILTVNDQMVIKHMEAWKQTHPNYDSMSSDDIFFRRGIGIDALFDTSQLYREWDYINAYSLAFSAPEKFAQMREGRMPALVNADVHLFDGRVLFSRPSSQGWK